MFCEEFSGNIDNLRGQFKSLQENYDMLRKDFGIAFQKLTFFLTVFYQLFKDSYSRVKPLTQIILLIRKSDREFIDGNFNAVFIEGDIVFSAKGRSLP